MLNVDNMAAGDAYKKLQNEFISDEDGTSCFEISLVTACAPCCILLKALVFQSFIENKKRQRETPSNG